MGPGPPHLAGSTVLTAELLTHLLLGAEGNYVILELGGAAIKAASLRFPQGPAWRLDGGFSVTPWLPQTPLMVYGRPNYPHFPAKTGKVQGARERPYTAVCRASRPDPEPQLLHVGQHDLV